MNAAALSGMAPPWRPAWPGPAKPRIKIELPPNQDAKA
jgi:hypothetical protein